MPTNEEILKMTTSAVVVGRVVVGEGGVERFIEINGEEGEMGMQEDARTGTGMQGWREQHGGIGMGRKMGTTSEVQTSSLKAPSHGMSNPMAWPSMNTDGTR